MSGRRTTFVPEILVASPRTGGDGPLSPSRSFGPALSGLDDQFVAAVCHIFLGNAPADDGSRHRSYHPASPFSSVGEMATGRYNTPSRAGRGRLGRRRSLDSSRNGDVRMSGDDGGSVTCWLGDLKGGDLAAAAAALGAVLLQAGRRGAGEAEEGAADLGRRGRGGRRPQRLQQLLRGHGPRPIPPARRPGRPLEAPRRDHRPQGHGAGPARGPEEARRRPRGRRGGPLRPGCPATTARSPDWSGSPATAPARSSPP